MKKRKVYKILKIPELLSPVGNEQALQAALNNGCDALYIGGESFNARASADNFTDERLCEIIDYAHLRGVKVYITINTLYKNNELDQLFKFVERMYEKGADAFIVQDIGTAAFIKQHFKDIRLHASTQMTVHNVEGAVFLRSIGFDRIVLSRELSIEEIKKIKNESGAEIEVFVHGALCVSYSGQCTMSSIIGRRSGNRGKCAQTCRMPFELLKNGEAVKSGYLLSTKDIMTLGALKDLCEINVDSLKIEGRMKNAEYVSMVTRTYRNQLDKYLLGDFSVKSNDVKNLLKVFNRGGNFSSGYLNTYGGESMMSIDTPKNSGFFVGKVVAYDSKNKKCKIKFSEKIIAGDGIEILTKTMPHSGTNLNKSVEPGRELTIEIEGKIQKGDLVYRTFDKALTDSLKKSYVGDVRKITVHAEAKAKLGQPLNLTLKYNGTEISLDGETVVQAEKTPISKDKLIEQLSKTGNSPIALKFESIEVDENIFLNISAINALRRNSIELFEKNFVNGFCREKISYKLPVFSKEHKNKEINVSVITRQAFDTVVDTEIKNIYLDIHTADSDIDYFCGCAEAKGKNLYIELPLITRDADMPFLKKFIKESKGFKGYVVKNYGQLEILKDSEFDIVLGSSFNVMNSLSFEFLKQYVETIALSTELNFDEINGMQGSGAEITVYGKLPLMSLCLCPVGNFVGKRDGDRFCSQRFSEDKYALKDRKDLTFDIKTNCFECNADIFNANTILMTDKLKDILKSAPQYIRLSFLDEEAAVIRSVIAAYMSFSDDEVFKFILDNNNVTHAHFYRGVF